MKKNFKIKPFKLLAQKVLEGSVKESSNVLNTKCSEIDNMTLATYLILNCNWVPKNKKSLFYKIAYLEHPMNVDVYKIQLAHVLAMNNKNWFTEDLEILSLKGKTIVAGLNTVLENFTVEDLIEEREKDYE